MPKYFLEYELNGTNVQIPLSIVENVDYSAPQGIIQYESVGSNGGTALNTGRLTKTITWNGKLTHLKRQQGNTVTIVKDYNKIKNEIENLKENGTVVTLIMPLSTNDAGKYLIKDFGCTLGAPSYLPFTVQFTEYRQANTKITAINLVNSGPKEQFLTRLRASLQGA